MKHIGQRLREKRLEKGLSLEDVAEATKIRQSFLTAIEKGEYHKLPSSSYAQGFVQNYGIFLGFSKREILALFRREFDENKVYKVLPEGFVDREAIPNKRIKVRQAFIAAVFVVFAVGVFLLYQYRSAFIDPPLEVKSPSEGVKTQQEITIAGSTDPNVTLTVNNIPVSVNQDGSFEKRVAAFPGKTVIIIRAVNKFGRDSVIQRTVEVSPNP